MTQPQSRFADDSGEIVIPGSPRWYLSRLSRRLLGRQWRYDRLERYALGLHDLPNGDKRYVEALRELQLKCITNYCALVGPAVTQRMKVIGFQFGPEQQVDEDAKKIWNYNDMDYQSPLILNTACTFGDTYVLVSPPIEPDGEPVVTAEDPRLCITEVDPRLPTRLLAGLKMWQEEDTGTVFAALYLPEQIRLYEGQAVQDYNGADGATLTHVKLGRDAASGGFRLIAVSPNPIGEVPLIRGNWQPAFGTMGRGEFENVMHIQDRINHAVLDRLVIAKAQAYNQRWISGAQKGENFKPGADMIWATLNSDATFGQFDAVDLAPVLAAVRDDVGDLAAVSQTPATYLMNRMVNVSGDTLAQDQAALITKVHLRSESMGWMYERVMRIAFKIKGNTAKAKETEVVTLWRNPEIHTLAEIGDSFSKFTTGGVPLDIAMSTTGLWTDDQIASAKEQFDAALKATQDHEMAVTKASAQFGSKPGSTSGAKPSPGGNK